MAVYKLLATAATVAMELPLSELIGRAENVEFIVSDMDVLIPVEPPEKKKTSELSKHFQSLSLICIKQSCWLIGNP